MHEQEPAPSRSLQIALAPQGDGLQGCGISVMTRMSIKIGISSVVVEIGRIYRFWFLRGTTFWQPENGSPSYPSLQVHRGT